MKCPPPKQDGSPHHVCSPMEQTNTRSPSLRLSGFLRIHLHPSPGLCQHYRKDGYNYNLDLKYETEMHRPQRNDMTVIVLFIYAVT